VSGAPAPAIESISSMSPIVGRGNTPISVIFSLFAPAAAAADATTSVNTEAVNPTTVRIAGSLEGAVRSRLVNAANQQLICLTKLLEKSSDPCVHDVYEIAAFRQIAA
jgi:hypothetical protein